ncbi:MAG: V4R domain-containing protein [Candidatus Woesearchaeota archaeon]
MKKQLIQLMSRIIGFKAISFDGHHIILLKVPMIFIPYETLVRFQEALVQKLGFETAYAIMFGLGRIQGYNGTSIYIKNYNIQPDASDLNFFLEQAHLVGLGKITIEKVDMESRHGILIYHNSPEAVKYKDLYGLQKNPVDLYQLGMISGAAQAVLRGKDIIGIEKQCLAKGDPNCFIELKERDVWLSEGEYSKQLPAQLKDVEQLSKIETLSSLLEPIQIDEEDISPLMLQLSKLKKNVYTFSEQGINLLDINGMITPIEILSLLAYVANKLSADDGAEIFYNTGFDEGKLIFESLNRVLHFKRDFSSVSMAFEAVGLLGLGSAELLRADMKSTSFLVKVKDNYLAKKYLKFFGMQKKPFDHYLTGILAGIASSLTGEKLTASEVKCVVQGAQACTFEIKK